jgi:hypothetical protein
LHLHGRTDFEAGQFGRAGSDRVHLLLQLGRGWVRSVHLLGAVEAVSGALDDFQQLFDVGDRLGVDGALDVHEAVANERLQLGIERGHRHADVPRPSSRRFRK